MAPAVKAKDVHPWGSPAFSCSLMAVERSGTFPGYLLVPGISGGVRCCSVGSPCKG